MFDLTPAQRSDLRAVVERMSPRQQSYLDPGDEVERRVIELFLDLSNKRSDRYPALHAALAEPQPPQDGGRDDFRLVDLGMDAGGRATARAWHGAQGSSLISGAAALALDRESGEPLAFGAGSQVGHAFAPAATVTETARPAGGGVTGVGFFHAQSAPDAPPRFGIALDERPDLSANSGIQMNLSDPCIQITGHTTIKIAIGRQSKDQCSDADYCYVEPNQNLTDPNLLVPFVGSTTLQGTISGVDPNSKNISELGIYTRVYAQSTYLKAIKAASLGQLVTVPDPNSPGFIQCAYQYDGLGQDTTQSLQYAGVGLPQCVTGAFFFQFSVPIEGQPYPAVFSVCSPDYPSAPSNNCTQVCDLDFYWHCLAGGAQVTLEDGSTVPIESVDNTMRVRTGIGDGSLGVEATTRGMHQDHGGPGAGVRLLRTEGGRELTLTMHHPVVTPSGPVMACDLQPGDAVLTDAGPDPVSAVEPVQSSGAFFNLELVTSRDRARGLRPAFGSFMANGIVVGDMTSQTNYYRATRRDLDYMFPRLPDALHRDYASAVEDAAARD